MTERLMTEKCYVGPFLRSLCYLLFNLETTNHTNQKRSCTIEPSCLLFVSFVRFVVFPVWLARFLGQN
jgi:hypothetical protein